MFRESNSRSLLKAISWRFRATVTTAFLVLAITGKYRIALLIGGIEVVLKMVMYFLHERIWNKLPFGKKEYTPKVIWLTGLSGSRKSSIAEELYSKINTKG